MVMATHAQLGRCAKTAAGADWFSELSAQLQKELGNCMTPRTFGMGQAIYIEGDMAEAMYRIVSGRVRIRSMSPFGKEVLMVIYGPGHCIGTVSVLDGLPRQNDAVAESAAILDVLSAVDFHRIANMYPQLYKSVAVSYAMWIRDIHTMFVGGYSLEERLARRLDFLLDFGGEREVDRVGLRLDFTQEMLASSIAVSRQAISKLLQDWQDSGIIEYKYGSLTVLDRSRLRLLACKQIN